MTMQKTTIHKPLLLSSLVISDYPGRLCNNGNESSWRGWPVGRLEPGYSDIQRSSRQGFLKPMAKGYQWITPEFVDEGITNFFSNINDIGVTINDFACSLNSHKAVWMQVVSWFNTTAGVGRVCWCKQTWLICPSIKKTSGRPWVLGAFRQAPIWCCRSSDPARPRDAVGLVGDALFNPLTYVSHNLAVLQINASHCSFKSSLMSLTGERI